MVHENPKPIGVKLGVKPIYSTVIHKDSIEGPCRTGSEEGLNPKTERENAKKRLDKLKEEATEILNMPEVETLKPVYLELGHKGGWLLSRKELKKLEPDLQKTDIYFGYETSFPKIAAALAAEKYKKSVIIMEKSFPAYIGIAESIAQLRAKDIEGYYPMNHSELRHIISLLQVKKAITKTKILRVTDIKFTDNSNFRDLDNLKRTFGIEYKDVTIDELGKEIDRVRQNGQKEAEEITDNLIDNARAVHMKRGDITDSVNFYLGVRRLMNRYECNAFTIDCFEICPDKRVTFERKSVPCLTHTLLKDDGYPSVCEGDITELLTMMFLMYISKKSAYMGNPQVIDEKKNIMGIFHDVPGIKMKGLTQPGLPYEIRPFTCGGWGAIINYDFSRDRGEEVTVARFNPSRNKILVASGEITGGQNFDSKCGCNLGVLIKVSDVVDFFHKNVSFGNHYVMVYGNYVKELKGMGDIMNFEVVEA